MNDSAVFRSTGQALHISFLMEVLTPVQKGSTQLVIESLKRSQFVIEGDGLHSINTAGLSPLEMRAQCAMVRASVDHHLGQAERAAVWCRYGRDRRKQAGVGNLSAYLEPMLSLKHCDALLALTMACFMPRTRRPENQGKLEDWSLRRIEKRYGVPKSTLHDSQVKIREHAGHLERRAEYTLQELFERTGLVESAVTA